LETNQISRDWTVLHEGRTFYVNYTESDGQTLALVNRDNWEIWEQTDDGMEELEVYAFSGDSNQKRRQAQENSEIMKRLIRFCIENWDNQFMQKIKENLQEQKEALDAL